MIDAIDKIEIVRRKMIGETMREIAEKFECSPSTISRIIKDWMK